MYFTTFCKFLLKIYNQLMTQEKKFISYFLKSAYMNMYMEDEAVYDEEELEKRYRHTLKWLIKEWVHKWLTFKA